MYVIYVGNIYVSQTIRGQILNIWKCESEHLIGWFFPNMTNEMGLFCNPGFWLGSSNCVVCITQMFRIWPLRVCNPYHHLDSRIIVVYNCIIQLTCYLNYLGLPLKNYSKLNCKIFSQNKIFNYFMCKKIKRFNQRNPKVTLRYLFHLTLHL
jgi:hypothetical protein